MSSEPQTVLQTSHKPNVLKQYSLSQKSSENISCRPRTVLRTSFGGPVCEPGRCATAGVDGDGDPCRRPTPASPVDAPLPLSAALRSW
eukprot:4877946-Pyramimonas_sp.AAC.1